MKNNNIIKFILAASICTGTVISVGAAELYVSTESLSVYDEYQSLINKRFNSYNSVKGLPEFSFTGTASFDEGGIYFPEYMKKKVGITVKEKLSGSYIIKTNVKRFYENGVNIYFAQKDSRNYAYVRAYNNVKSEKVTNLSIVCVTNNVPETVAEAVVDDITYKNVEFKINVAENNVSVSLNYGTGFENIFNSVECGVNGGNAGVYFEYSHGYIKSFEIYTENPVNTANEVECCAVSYEKLGECVAGLAFYEDSRLKGFYIKDVEISDIGNNYFTIPVENTESLVNSEMKCFLFDSLNNMKPLSKSGLHQYSKNGFSGELEPYYPHKSAYDLKTNEIHDLISVGESPTDKETEERLKVVEMYKNLGYDISINNNSYLDASGIIANAPKRFSRLTPESLTGDYDQMYSSDAPWNNKIPENHPSVSLATWNSVTKKMQIGVTRDKFATKGNGIGIPIIIGRKSDPYYIMACKYNTNSEVYGKLFRAGENFGDYTNYHTSGDNHAIFINDEAKTSLQTIKIMPPGSPYSLDKGLLPGFDARAQAVTREIELNGMGGRKSGTNAAGVPLDAFTVKKNELINPDKEINHAIAGALGNMMKARVYPAVSMDNWIHKATDNANATGSVPYGGVVRISPDINLENIYKNGKLSMPAYKLLKAWRDYGFYNIDANGGSHDNILLYTSTAYDDWNFPVPFGGTGLDAVTAEINAFLSGDSFFGISKKPEFLLTAPVVKSVSFDVNGDGFINEKDYTSTTSQLNTEMFDEIIRHDFNCDKKVDETDVQIIRNFLDGNPQYAIGDYTVSVTQTTGGRVRADITNPYEGEYVNACAYPNVGYEFVGWSGEFEGETSNVVRFKADRDYKLKAVFKRSETVSFNVEVVGPGKVYASTTKSSFSTPAATYGKNTLLALKAVPDEGYVLGQWEGDAQGYNEITDILVDRDMNVTAVFRETDICETFNDTVLGSDWKLVFGSESDIKLSGGKLSFVNWGLKCVLVINNSQELLSGEKFEITAAANLTTTGTNSANKGLIVFGYNDEDETAYAIDFSRDATFRLAKVNASGASEMASFGAIEALDVTKSMTFNLKYDENGMLGLSISQNGTVYTVFENYNIGTGLTGKFGVGGSYMGSLGFDKFFMERTETESDD